MTVADQLEDVIRLSDELDFFKAQRDKCATKADGRDPGKLASHDAVVADAEAHLASARELVPEAALAHVDALRAARAAYTAAVSEIADQFDPPQPASSSATGQAHDATVVTKES